MHAPFACQQDELTLCEVWVNKSMRDAMKSQVPRGKPRIFPLVRHREHVTDVDVRPLLVPARFAFRRRCRLSRVALNPLGDVVVVTLLIPEHTCQGLTLHTSRVLV